MIKINFPPQVELFIHKAHCTHIRESALLAVALMVIWMIGGGGE